MKGTIIVYGSVVVALAICTAIYFVGNMMTPTSYKSPSSENEGLPFTFVATHKLHMGETTVYKIKDEHNTCYIVQGYDGASISCMKD